MRLTADSYLTIILCEFLAFFIYLWYVEFSERSEKHIKTCFLHLHSFYRYSATHNIQTHLSRNKSMDSVSLFLRPERLNWKYMRL